MACLAVKMAFWMAVGTTILAAIGPWLPFTLIGNEVRRNALNWVWICIIPLFFLAPALLHFSLNRLWLILILWPFILIENVLSNIDWLKDSFVWKMIEITTGLLVLCPYLLT
jgi:hypothetical protein